MVKLSILIPSIVERAEMLEMFLSSINKQSSGKDVEVVTCVDNREMSIGTKRNHLLGLAKGEFLSHLDEDDRVSDDYVESILKALERNPDTVGFEGRIIIDGVINRHWKISKDLPYEERHVDGELVYFRHTNHLSPIRTSIARKIGYKDMRFAEDYDYAVRLKQSGLLKTEVYIPKELYFYQYKSNK